MRDVGPGHTGDRARELGGLAARAALGTGRGPEQLVGPQAMLWLLYQRRDTPEGVAATTGVGLRGKWAEEAGRLLKV